MAWDGSNGTAFTTSRSRTARTAG